MEKFGMSFGGGPSRKELLEALESQKKQLVQYQTRFKDVVRAYKSLLKEKEALEASLKVLTMTQDTGIDLPDTSRAEPTEDRCSVYSEESLDQSEYLDRTPSLDQTEEDSDQQGNRSSFTADTEHHQTVSFNNHEATASRSIEVDLQKSTAPVSLPLPTTDTENPQAPPIPQTEVGHPQTTPPADTEVERRMLQLRSQLSTLTSALATVTQEKSRMEASFQGDKRQLKQELEEMRERLASLATQQEAERQQLAESRARVITQQHEREQEQADHAQQLRELQQLLQQERQREEERRADPRAEHLEAELLQLRDQVQLETCKACTAEEHARERAEAAEARVACLEQRVSELSELLGSSEKARQREQQAAQRLRERVLQLDSENAALADRDQLEVLKLQAARKLLQAERVPDCQQELQQLKEDFERYKVRAQVVLKNRNAKDGSQARELEETRAQLEEMRAQQAELREKYITLRIQAEEAEAQHRAELQGQQQRAAAQQQERRQEAERAAAAHTQQLLRLEAELHKQRERSAALLEEKERHVERLRAALEPRAPQDEPTDSDALSADLRRAAPPEATMLLYAEQLARRDVEVGALRRQKNQLDEDLHQLQARMLMDAERRDEEAEQLRARLDKLVRDQSREGANMEYLKNIVFRFLTLQDSGGRRQTLGAILTILHFSPQEKQQVLKLQGSGWWGAGSR